MATKLFPMFTDVQPTPICDSCGNEFNRNFAMGTRIYSERVWLCSPKCAHALKSKWMPTPKKSNRGLVSFVSNLFNGVN